MDRARGALLDLGAGLLLTAALPPFGWWPLALAGAAVLAVRLPARTLRGRLGTGFATGLGFLLPGLAWMIEFSAPGWVLASLIEAGLFALGLAVLPPGRAALLALPAGLLLAEALRGAWPFGGVPLPTLGSTQIGGPLAPAARLGGWLALAALVGVAGVALAALVRRRLATAAVATLVAVAVPLAGAAVDPGEPVEEVRVAVVQGGGPRGERDNPGNARRTFEAHVDATDDVGPGADLVLWPEDVVDVDGPVEESERGRRLAGLAVEVGAPIAAGVVEGYEDEFRNALVVWSPDGEIVARYDKVQRVPFGEFIPFRDLVERVADVSDVPRDAATGEGPGIVEVDGDPYGVVISFEVFFARRARAALRAGGEVLLAPTNASSYPTGQMPALELAAARVRAWETGRDVLQAAPTGFSAVVAPDGEVRAASDLGDPAVLEATVSRREGQTPYTRLGDGPLVVGALVVLALAWVLAVRRRGEAT